MGEKLLSQYTCVYRALLLCSATSLSIYVGAYHLFLYYIHTVLPQTLQHKHYLKCVLECLVKGGNQGVPTNSHENRQIVKYVICNIVSKKSQHIVAIIGSQSYDRV